MMSLFRRMKFILINILYPAAIFYLSFWLRYTSKFISSGIPDNFLSWNFINIFNKLVFIPSLLDTDSHIHNNRNNNLYLLKGAQNSVDKQGNAIKIIASN